MSEEGIFFTQDTRPLKGDKLPPESIAMGSHDRCEGGLPCGVTGEFDNTVGFCGGCGAPLVFALYPETRRGPNGEVGFWIIRPE